MKEVLKIGKNREEFKINFLTVMLVGKSGVGKSTLINNLLKLDENERAETGTGNYITTNI
ncbi:MAG: 50S ribosome-binding GTPase, partial [Bacteroidales bacterium]|nr:50S ribosome-binding GTPase [Bacteroidales bacterium]